MQIGDLEEFFFLFEIFLNFFTLGKMFTKNLLTKIVEQSGRVSTNLYFFVLVGELIN